MIDLLDRYCRMLDFLIAAMLAVMVVLVFGNVVLRYGFNSGITVSEEISRWLFIWVTFLGAIVALRRGEHLGTELVVQRLPLRAKKVVFCVAHVVMLYMCWLFLSGSWQQARINLDVGAPITGASMAIFYLSGIVFSLSAAVILGLGLFRVLAGRMREDELVAVQESEETAEIEAVLKARDSR